MWWLVVCCLAFTYAGRAPYLGEDLEVLIEKTKRSGVTAIPRDVSDLTPEQKRDYEKYNTKFTEIAKAYAEGYKAAIKAVQARAIIAQKRLQQNQLRPFSSRSTIPEAPNSKTDRSDTSLFQPPVAIEKTENGLEKSDIPHPPDSFNHKMVQRSAIQVPGEQHESSEPLENNLKRNEIAQANFAARHRNVYLDSISGDVYNGAGGVLTRQNVYFSKQKRRRRSVEDADESTRVHHRQRRSRMPYLGQNLDALGIIRATPNWGNKAEKKSSAPQPPSMYLSQQPPPPAANPVYIRQPIPPQQLTPESYAQAKGYYRANIPLPVYQQHPAPPPAAITRQQQQMAAQMKSYLQAAQARSYLPYAAQYNRFNPYAAPQYGRLTAEQSNSVENMDQTKYEELPGIQRKKKSTVPEPDAAQLSYGRSDGFSQYGGARSLASQPNKL